MSGIHRFLTRRDKSKHAKPNNEETLKYVARSDLHNLLAPEPPAEGDKEQEKKIKLLGNRIAQLGITNLKDDHIGNALQSDYAQGNVDKAFELLLLVEDSIEGIIRDYSPSTKLLGAENRQGVTCYLDSLLFAMFARLDCFEAILYKSFNDEPRQRLSVLLKLWVNMLRSGMLITTDITERLQNALSDCGWEDAAELRQQDASEAFTFITEKLELPLLTLKMDIYHTGKEDASDDHKFVNERLLEVAIPPEPADGKPLTLEDCLEAYFNNRIEVKRYLERRNTVTSIKSTDNVSISKGFITHIEAIETGSSATSSPNRSTSPWFHDLTPMTSLADLTPTPTASTGRRRSDSIVQERFIPGDDENTAGSSNGPYRKGSYRKEVMMPAWQFFSLIPWYTYNTPTNDAQVAAHFSSKRPILGLCLKRYSMLPNGQAVRLNTHIDIPTEIGLPHFIQDDKMDADGPIYGNFKLSLQAFVCHRGNSVDSGHYIAVVRGTRANTAAEDPRGTEADLPDPSDYWMRFDDLAAERVTLVDVEQALKTESPYLLFYQILPINEDASPKDMLLGEDAIDHDQPPSYMSSEFMQNLDMREVSQSLLALSTSTFDLDRPGESASTRPSFEITGPDNSEPELPSNLRGRRQSVVFSDAVGSSVNSGSLRVSSASPKLTPRDDDGRASFSWSRRGSRATKSNIGSRSGSQSGEKRISATFSRFTGRLSRDKTSPDGSYVDGEPDETTLRLPTPQAGDVAPPFNGAEINEKANSKGRARDRDRAKGKAREKPRDKGGRNLDRECLVM
ncbi:hypothetical protein ASPZODRAFT_61021 [Penicilliopsis zonata CBS 506.65]|uniref:ubiquitinyl hydrolase 1 n=1 Tax=Penicilliopsis zonata CBS 506.65 TaxID=1073090 RepID=A0A1L9SP29_9EURO|nr:hypothetical protein ASPZODRAFT_61021 [Penicilliopsis zonata CBS 506.65]OJJ48861.1 hypothetical protein ASPZODRAFT_61021 [Penicilliopsis zonata CBS 506.65]